MVAAEPVADERRGAPGQSFDRLVETRLVGQPHARRIGADQVVDADVERRGQRGEAAETDVRAPTGLDLADRRPAQAAVMCQRLAAPAASLAGGTDCRRQARRSAGVIHGPPPRPAPFERQYNEVSSSELVS